MALLKFFLGGPRDIYIYMYIYLFIYLLLIHEMLVILILKNNIFLYKQKYLHQIIIYIFAKQKTKKSKS